ncbi:MAG: hypothetical protein JNK04_03645 [Myxococcales bacterium]|nr:hypothetical protein [Myxococcales bacterium]
MGKHLVTLEHEGELCGWMRHDPVTPEEEVWLTQAVGLAIPFAREVSEDPGSQMIDFIVVNRAAEVLWAASPGSPHWRDLDVEAFLAALERHNMPSWLPRDNAIGSLFAFTHFLAKYGHITADEARVLRSRLDPYVPALFLAAGYRPAPLPPDLQPS